MSANGFVARENGDEDFISHDNWVYFCDLANKYKNFIAGRKTYEAVKNWQDGYGFDDLKVEKVIVSHNSKFAVGDAYTVANSPRDALDKLQRKGFKEVLLAGGPSLNSAFAREGLIDEVILNIEPVFIGKGRPVFFPEEFEFRAEPISVEKSSPTVTTIRYRVNK
ncbi:MAG: dihydrofolate reductase family protein [Candidatus Taylorbacteria bacterium]|nr:dihydrofolate reductase family protein [Candidatus Taylorbacteria bacterium]